MVKKKWTKKDFIKLGSKGGNRTKDLYGTPHFSMAGKKGVEAKKRLKESSPLKDLEVTEILPNENM